jgi:hypothetical protein
LERKLLIWLLRERLSLILSTVVQQKVRSDNFGLKALISPKEVTSILTKTKRLLLLSPLTMSKLLLGMLSSIKPTFPMVQKEKLDNNVRLLRIVILAEVGLRAVPPKLLNIITMLLGT